MSENTNDGGQDDDKHLIALRINVAGYAGKAVSVIAAFDTLADFLLIGGEEDYSDSADPELLKLTNQARDKAYDGLFTEDDTHDAIKAYFELDALKLLEISSEAQRCNPGSKLERDGMDQHGMRYRVAPDITCGQVAVLIAALHAGRLRSMTTAADFMQEMALITI